MKIISRKSSLLKEPNTKHRDTAAHRLDRFEVSTTASQVTGMLRGDAANAGGGAEGRSRCYESPSVLLCGVQEPRAAPGLSSSAYTSSLSAVQDLEDIMISLPELLRFVICIWSIGNISSKFRSKFQTEQVTSGHQKQIFRKRCRDKMTVLGCTKSIEVF